ncbi:sugar nucleotide-binding protein [Streptomyces sp. NBC_00846]|nr:sugar nucleotide-binding protein [Streptomyces sp. NBC_00846]
MVSASPTVACHEGLIIGGSGFLGSELVRQAAAAGLETAATFATRAGAATAARWYRLDVRESEQVAQVIADVTPCAVINASSGLADWAVTAEGAIRVAMTVAQQGCRMVHVSSDAVFSGVISGSDLVLVV